MNLNSVTASLWIILGIAVATIALIIYCVITGKDIPPVVMTLLGVVLGFLGSHLSSAQGATQALATPASLLPQPPQVSSPLPQPTTLRLPPGLQFAPAPALANAPVAPSDGPVAFTHPETGKTTAIESTAI